MRHARMTGMLALALLVGIGFQAMSDTPQPTASDWWDQLATGDEAQATRAILALAARPKEAVEILGKKLEAIKVDKAKVSRWIEQLGDDTFAKP